MTKAKEALLSYLKTTGMDEKGIEEFSSILNDTVQVEVNKALEDTKTTKLANESKHNRTLSDIAADARIIK